MSLRDGIYVRTRVYGPINCEKWNCNSLQWFLYWMQSLPGRDNGLYYQGKSLTNWWTFIGDFDTVMRDGLKLVSN